VDAILHVRSLTEAKIQEGRVVLTVSLNISNAFNTLPWDYIGRAFQYHNVPPYLYRGSFGTISKIGGSSTGTRTESLYTEGYIARFHRGLLGLLLWNLGYNAMLTTIILSLGCTVVCYANDTVILAERTGERQSCEQMRL